MATMTIGIESLFLDPQNPRHEVVKSQNEAIRAIIEEQKSKLSNLAGDIAANGLSPLDRVLVFKSGRRYVVLEGNRRVVALKLLKNPGLADGTEIEKEIKKIVAAAKSVPTSVDCAVIGSREEAKRWLTLRHSGEQDGRGVVGWNPVASARFSALPGSREAKWVTLIDTIQAAYPANTGIQDDLQTIIAGRMTTLGRLYSDPDFRDHVGFEDDGEKILSRYPASVIEPILERVLRDLATELSVTKIKSKEQRAKYVAGLPKPKASERRAQAQPLVGGGGSAGSPTKTSRRPAKPAPPFKNLDLRKLGQRIENILRELQHLDLEKFPNAVAVLSRVLLELSLDQFMDVKKLTISKQNPKLKDKLKRCLHELDPTSKETRYQGVRAGLADSSSIHAIWVLHGYVHNKDFHPTPTDVRSIIANLKPFLQDMNDRV